MGPRIRTFPSSVLGFALLALGNLSCGDSETPCHPACEEGEICRIGICLSACPRGCGFNETCVGPDECLSDGPAPYTPDSCTQQLGCFVALEAYGDRTCAVLVDHTVWCWGENDDGALATESLFDHGVPVHSLVFDAPVLDVAIGFPGLCALFDDGSVACYGGPDSQPVDEPPGPTPLFHLTDVADFELGSHHGCALMTDGTVVCFGGNEYGQIGVGNRDSGLGAQQVAGAVTAVQLAVGSKHTCVLDTNTRVWCWGANEYGQLGLGDRQDRLKPTILPDFTGVTALTAAGNHSCAVAENGVSCWGVNWSHQVNPQHYDEELIPYHVDGTEEATSVVTGSNFTCAELGDGLHCWGELQGDPYASPDVTNRHTGSVVLSAAGSEHLCGVLTTGGMFCIGKNHDGQLGDGTFDHQGTPVWVRW